MNQRTCGRLGAIGVLVGLLAIGAAPATGPAAGRIAAGDRVEVRIMDLVGPGLESVERRRVAEDGTVELPHVGKVKVAGEDVAGAERAIREGYAKAKVLPRADVTVKRLGKPPATREA